MIKTNDILKYRNIWMTIAIVGVIIFHMNPIGSCERIHSIQSIGYGGVDIFLFASGVGCYYSYYRVRNPYLFLKRRMIKILPMYYFSLMLYFINNDAITNSEAIANVLSFSYIGGVNHNINWYISFMWLTYILVPFVFEYVEESRSEVWACISITIVAILFGVSFIGNDAQLLPMSRMAIFVIGMCCGKIFKELENVNMLLIALMFVAAILGCLLEIKIIKVYPDETWKYGLYWFPFILIVPGLCLGISAICFTLSKKMIMEKLIRIVGKTIGENTFPIFLADSLGEKVSVLLGAKWDTIESYRTSKIIIIPLAIVIRIVGYLFELLYNKYKLSKNR